MYVCMYVCMCICITKPSVFSIHFILKAFVEINNYICEKKLLFFHPSFTRLVFAFISLLIVFSFLLPGFKKIGTDFQVFNCTHFSKYYLLHIIFN